MDKNLDSNLEKKYPSRGEILIEDKLVRIPSFYIGEGISAVFAISYKKACELIDSKNIVPAKLTLSTALVNITVFDFKKSPVGPYTELVYSIPVIKKTFVNIPLIPLIFNKHWENFGVYVLDIMQNTDIAVKHGDMLTGYPHNKKLIDVKFTKENLSLLAEITRDGKPVLSLSSVLSSKLQDSFQTFLTYFIKNKDLFRIEMDIFGKEEKIKKCKLYLADNEMSKIIRDLGVQNNSTSLQTQYFPFVTEVNPVTIQKV
jgi:hypothetical protein